MVNGFYTLHTFLAKRRWMSMAVLLLLFTGMGYLAVRIPLEEDVTKLIPVKDADQDLQRVLRTVRFTDKIVVNIALQGNGDENDLTGYADRFLDSLHARCEPFVEAVQGQVGSDDLARTMAYVQENLPQFLDDADYQKLAGVIRHDSLAAINERNFRTLISPSGLIAKDIIRQDPLGLTFEGLSKLKGMGVGDALTLHNGYLLSQDHRNLLLFITPKISSDRTAENDVFVNTLYAINSGLNKDYQGKVSAEYFGSVLIAVANAERIKADVRNSMVIAVVLLLALLLFFFRRASVSIILFVPSLFGGLLGICVLYFLRDSVSAISLGIGSVDLGLHAGLFAPHPYPSARTRIGAGRLPRGGQPDTRQQSHHGVCVPLPDLPPVASAAGPRRFLRRGRAVRFGLRPRIHPAGVPAGEEVDP